jgi:tetratricopeptide (TPR) repeat protein
MIITRSVLSHKTMSNPIKKTKSIQKIGSTQKAEWCPCRFCTASVIQPIPSSSTLLNRPQLIKDIENQLAAQQEQSIQTVALTGIGGSGKTTLAHQYAISQRLSVIWEINAQTQESLRQSFEQLARALSKSEEDLKELKRLQELSDPEERKERILSFVKEKLRYLSPWLLIYDNVEQFVDIQEFFPYDSQSWGQGKVIITTRDSNIQQNKYINSFVPIGELSPDQKFILFSQIMARQTNLRLSPQKIKEIRAFLEKLPPFPLDICIAAYYLQATNISDQVYLTNLRESHTEFMEIQKSLLDGMGHYTNSRYNIIRLSFQKLIKMNKDFSELLVLISLIDSQHIPRRLLEFNKSRMLVDNFIIHLKKYSLITHEHIPSTHTRSDLSLHRSTQEIGLNYLNKTLGLAKNSQLMEVTINTLEKYMESIEEAQNYEAMKNLANHYEFLLNHRNVLSEVMIASIYKELGIVYFYLSQYKQAQNLLEKSLSIYHTHPINNPKGIARVLVYLGNVYRKMGDNLKARDLLEQGLGFYKKYMPQNHNDIFNNLVYLGTVYRNLGLYEKSRDLFEASLTLQKSKLPEHLKAYARVLAHLGNVYRKLGNYEKSKDLLGQSLLMHKKVFSKNHACVGWVYAYLGNVFARTGEYEKAVILLEQSLTIFKENYPHDHVDVAWVSALLARAYNLIGKYEAARSLLEKNLLVYKKAFPNKG